MSIPLPASVNNTSSASAPSSRPGWLREPLLHFLLLGGLLFGLDHYLVSRSDDPRTIVVGAAVDAEAKQVFKASRGRESRPTLDAFAAGRGGLQGAGCTVPVEGIARCAC